jgi:hypothetical protein
MPSWLPLVFSCFALLIAVFALMRANRLSATFRRARLSYPESDEQGRAVVTLPDVQGPLNRVAVVRFDAFADISGKLSSSAAVLDENGNGLVITTMNGRDSTRSYLKEVRRGAGVSALSPEEANAVARAIGSGKMVS